MDVQRSAPPESKGLCYDLLNRPLGGFALMGVWVGIVELICVAFAIQAKDQLADCKPLAGVPLGVTQVGIWNWLMITGGGALMHVLFAPYVHLQLWRNLISEAKEVDDPSKGMSARTKEARRQGGKISVSRHDVFESFKETFRGDPVIYFYSFVLVLDFAWTIVGLIWIHGDDKHCNAGHWILRVAYASGVYFLFIVGYSIAWYFYMNNMDMTDTITLVSPETAPPPGYQSPKNAAQGKSDARVDDEEVAGGSFCCAGSPPAKPSGSSGSTVALNPVKQSQSEKPKLKRKPSVMLALPKLAACVTLDALGNATYFVPGVGELGDAVFAPASAVMMKMLFDRNGIAGINGIEEILPATDIMPTACLAWFMETIIPDTFISRMFGLNTKMQ